MSKHHALTNHTVQPRGAEADAEEDDWETADLSAVAPLKALSLRADAPTFQPTASTSGRATKPATTNVEPANPRMPSTSALQPSPVPGARTPFRRTELDQASGPREPHESDSMTRAAEADDWEDETWDAPRRGASGRQLWTSGSNKTPPPVLAPPSGQASEMAFPPPSSASLNAPAPPPTSSSSSFSVGPPTSYAPQIKILRRDRPGGSTAAGAGAFGSGGGPGRKDITLQEREAAYKAARERIFGSESGVAPSSPAGSAVGEIPAGPQPGGRSTSGRGGQRSGPNSGSSSPLPSLAASSAHGGQGQGQKREKSSQGFSRGGGAASAGGSGAGAGAGAGRGQDRGRPAPPNPPGEKKVEGVLRMPNGPGEGGGFRPAQ